MRGSYTFRDMPTFVLVGHCGPDSYLMKNAVARAVPGATVVLADDAESLRTHLRADAVLLINRVLDDGFDTESGITLIESLAESEPKPVMILVSNLADAQQQAVAAGARPGFGKRDIYAERTKAILNEAAHAQ